MRPTSRTHRPFPITVTWAIVVAACGGADTGPATTRSEANAVVACDLITDAEAEAILGAATAEPSAHQSGDNTGCTLVGTQGAATIRVMLDYPGGESTSDAWAAELEEERRQQAADETDPDLKNVLANVRITPLDGLGVPTAVEDLRAEVGQVTLHAMKGGRGGTYLTVYADDLDTARAIAEKALARIP